jgi:CubicO group peptidase (beta-lactamase class C family)
MPSLFLGAELQPLPDNEALMADPLNLSQPALGRLHAAMAARVEKRELPGLVTLVARGDDVHVDCIGTTAFDGTVLMRRSTPFRVASLTKPVVAAVTMMLVDDGTLALDDPVERWLPELANPRVLKRVDGPLDETQPAYRSITVEDLLTLRLGTGMLLEPTMDRPIPIVQAGNDLQLVLGEPDPPTPHQPDEWMRRFASLPLMYQPRERWLYNVVLVRREWRGRAAMRISISNWSTTEADVEMSPAAMVRLAREIVG